MCPYILFRLERLKSMLSIIIPTYNSANCLNKAIEPLNGVSFVDEIIVVDGGSDDATQKMASNLGATVVQSTKGRGPQMKRGAQAAGGDWLLFLHSDTVLSPDWACAVSSFMKEARSSQHAGYFTFELDDTGVAAKRLEKIVAWRCRWLGLPYGDQGLLIRRGFYEEVGGFKAIPLMEDVDLVRRVGRKRLHLLGACAVTSSVRYQKSGYLKRMILNATCLGLFFLGVSPFKIVKLYR